MTVEELDKLILKGVITEVAPAFAELDEKQRRDLRTTAYQWFKDIRDGRGRSQSLLEVVRGDRSLNPYQSASLCVLATGTLKEASTVILWWVPAHREQSIEAVVQILRDRKPKWSKRWLEKRLEPEENFVPWALTERLISEGICDKPETDDYIRHFGDRFNEWGTELRPRLLERPHLLEDEIWRLFEVRSNAFAYDHSKYPASGENFEGWGTGLANLAADDVISRDRLLDAGINGLNRDFTQNIFTGFLRMLKEMKPTKDEFGTRQEILRELLGSPVTHVAKFALASLKKAKNLDAELYLQAALPVMQQSVKGNPLALLKHAEKLTQKSAELESAALPLFEAGGYHSQPDVREFAESWLRSRGHEVDSVEPELAVEEAELDFEGVDDSWMELLGLRVADFPSPFACPLDRLPILGGLETVTPIENLQELIDAVAQAVEEIDSGIEVERILGGLSRLCAERPPDFVERTEALHKRVEQYQGSEIVRGLVAGWGGLSSQLKQLLLVWLRGEYQKLEESPHYRKLNLYPFIQTRLDELAQRVGKGEAAPLLAEPTHAHGWLEPSRFVERLLSHQGEPGPADLIAALLRLAPQGRPEALKMAVTYKGRYADAVRWALGAKAALKGRPKDPEVWLAAARARQPRGQLDLPGLPAEATREADFSWKPKWIGDKYKFPRFDWAVDEAQAESKGAMSFLKGLFGRLKCRKELMPSLLVQQRTARSWETPDLQGIFIIRWFGLLWPSNLDNYWRQACDTLVQRVDMDTAATFPNFAYLDPLFEVDRSWGDLEYLTLSLALVTKDADTRGLGIDAMIEAVEDGRIHPKPFSEILGRLHEAGFVKPNRPPLSLGEVARVGGLHKRVVAELVDRLLCYPLPKGGHHILQLMLEVGDGISEEARQNLKGHTGGGKTGKLIKKLLALPEPTPLLKFREAALRPRIERARRYQD